MNRNQIEKMLRQMGKSGVTLFDASGNAKGKATIVLMSEKKTESDGIISTDRSYYLSVPSKITPTAFDKLADIGEIMEIEGISDGLQILVYKVVVR